MQPSSGIAYSDTIALELLKMHWCGCWLLLNHFFPCLIRLDLQTGKRVTEYFLGWGLSPCCGWGGQGPQRGVTHGDVSRGIAGMSYIFHWRWSKRETCSMLFLCTNLNKVKGLWLQISSLAIFRFGFNFPKLLLTCAVVQVSQTTPGSSLQNCIVWERRLPALPALWSFSICTSDTDPAGNGRTQPALLLCCVRDQPLSSCNALSIVQVVSTWRKHWQVHVLASSLLLKPC